MSEDRSHQPNRKIDIIEKSTVFQGYFRIDAYRLRHSLHAGGMSDEIRREVFERGHTVGLLPYDPARREIVMLEQFRIGAHVVGSPPWLMEIVAGIIEPGESDEEVARREAKEEAGLDVSDLILMQKYLVSPGGTTETAALYLGRVDATNAGGIFGCDDENEDIKSMVFSVPDALKLLTDGKLDNAQAVIALQWLALNENVARTRWGFEAV
jgi:ADP-ribose pyrophosphatase